MALTTALRVRALAGFQPRRVVEDRIGTGDGTNTIFAPTMFSFLVSPINSIPQSTDVTVRVDGASAGVASITENVVVLSNAPASGSSVVMDYWGSNISNTEIGTFIAEVDAQIIGMFYGRYTAIQLASSPLIGKIASYLAAASMTDEAYETAGLQTSQVYPSDRLRRVANDLLGQVVAGAITLLDTSNEALTADIESWITASSYDDKDRVFENDPFNVDDWGHSVVEPTRTPFEWDA
jgi:hypothetical protein